MRQKAIAEDHIEHLGSKIAGVLILNIGISSVIPSLESTIESLVKQADTALYDAK